ncbi:MAG: hypothetical protein DMF89_10065 [Acidobacteria bacterium]|nr:MAG: hypothetical protein DMF89_10065 [Acidobacteriota bacterium]
MTDRSARARLWQQATLVGYRALSDLVGKGAQLLIVVVAARQLSREDFGVFALGSTLGWIAAVASDFGIQLHVARSVAQGSPNLEQLLRTWFRVRLWTSTAAVVVLSAGLVVTGATPYTALVTILLVFVYLLNGLIEFLYYVFRGSSRTDLESTLTIWQKLSALVGAGVALWWNPTVVALGLGLVASSGATLLYALRRAYALPPLETQSMLPRPTASLASIGGEFRRDVLPIGAGIVLSALYFRVDLFLVELWRGTAAAGLYNAVFRLVEALRLFPAAVLAVALPALCRANGRGPLTRVTMLVTVVGLAVTTGLWFTADAIIGWLYGERYDVAVPVFRILLLGFPLMSFNYALTHQLVGWHRHGFYAAISAAALAVNVVLNVLFIPERGIVAAAWTTVWTEVAVSLGCLGSFAYLCARSSPGPRAHITTATWPRATPEPVEHSLVM